MKQLQKMSAVLFVFKKYNHIKRTKYNTDRCIICMKEMQPH